MTLDDETIRIRNRILTMVKRETPYYQQRKGLEGLRPLMQDVRDMVQKLRKEINTAPIDSIVKWHKDMRPNYYIKRLIRCIKHRRKPVTKGSISIGSMYWQVCGYDHTKHISLVL